MVSREFELRIAEAHIIAKFAGKGYERGAMLADGSIDSRGLALGRIISGSLRASYEATGVKPLAGLHAAAITMSTLAGYAGISGVKSGLVRLLNSTLYRSPSEDSGDLYKALEAVALTEYLKALQDEGVTYSSISMRSLTLGEIFETLSRVDTGFWLNLRDYTKLLEVANAIRGVKSLSEASMKAYLAVLEMLGVKIEGFSIKSLLSADKKLRERGFDGVKLLGGAYAALILYISGEEKPLSIA